MSIYLWDKIAFYNKNKHILNDFSKEMQKLFAFRILLHYICMAN